MLKVPHHGSADFLPEFLERVAPARVGRLLGRRGRERSHPPARRHWSGALGATPAELIKRPVIFITELAAFFRFVGTANGARPSEREAFGIVRCRTDGKRLLVYTETGERGKNEAYAFTVAADGTMTEAKVRTVGLILVALT